MINVHEMWLSFLSSPPLAFNDKSYCYFNYAFEKYGSFGEKLIAVLITEMCFNLHTRKYFCR